MRIGEATRRMLRLPPQKKRISWRTRLARLVFGDPWQIMSELLDNDKVLAARLDRYLEKRLDEELEGRVALECEDFLQGMEVTLQVHDGSRR